MPKLKNLSISYTKRLINLFKKKQKFSDLSDFLNDPDGLEKLPFEFIIPEPDEITKPKVKLPRWILPAGKFVIPIGKRIINYFKGDQHDQLVEELKEISNYIEDIDIDVDLDLETILDEFSS